MIKNLTEFVKESILRDAEDVLSLDNAYEIYKVSKKDFIKTSSSSGKVVSQCGAAIQGALKSGVYNLHTPSNINKITGFGVCVSVNKTSHHCGYLAFFDKDNQVIESLNGWYVPDQYGESIAKLRDVAVDVVNQFVINENLLIELLKGAQEYDNWFDNFSKDPKNRTYVGSAMLTNAASKILRNKDKNVFIDLLDKY